MRTLPAQKRLLPVVVALAAFVLASCGGGAETDDASSGGPLDEFFGEGTIEFSRGGMGMSYGGSEDFEIPEDELQRMRDTEDLVAQCMADEGFEYTANAINPEDWASSPWMEAQELPPDEFAEQYGYGVSTMQFSEIEEDLPQDPNQEYRESLSPEAAQAYERALFGDYMAWDGEDGPPPVEQRGCYGIAQAEIYGEDPFEGMEERADPWTEFEGLMSDVGSLGERIARDSRLEEAEQAWLDCMADAGYPEFEHVGDAEQVIYRRMDELYGLSEMEMEEPAIEEGASDGEGTTTIFEEPEIDPAELAELQEYEIELAVADRSCMAEHYDEVYSEVSHEMQEQFVEEHRAELERYRDWVAENDFDGGFGFGMGSGVSVSSHTAVG